MARMLSFFEGKNEIVVKMDKAMDDKSNSNLMQKHFPYVHLIIGVGASGPIHVAGEYEIEALSYGMLEHTSFDTGISYSDFAWALHLKRTPNFYVLKGIVPLYGTVFFAFLTFAVEPDQLGTRLSLLFGLFLTLFAIQWVTLERLPKLPFLTTLDECGMGAIGYLFLMAVGQAITYQLSREEVDTTALPMSPLSANTCPMCETPAANAAALAAASSASELDKLRLLATVVTIDRKIARNYDLICIGAIAALCLFYSIFYKLFLKVRRTRATAGMYQPYSSQQLSKVFKPQEGEMYRLHNLGRKDITWQMMGVPMKADEW